jgi:RNA methyltransferase, TrmH family
MITSKDNEKLKLIRKLAERKHRDREGLFVAEGEDLVAAAEAAGWEPRFVLRSGEDVEPALLDAVSALGSGTRVIGVYPQRWADEIAAPATYLHALRDPTNVGAVIRSADALTGGTVVIGPGSADPYSPRAVRASMGSVFSQPLVRAVADDTPRPRVALVAHGGEAPSADGDVVTLCLGSEREGLPADVVEGCDLRWTIPLRDGGAESLNVAAAAAIALGRISSAKASGEVL